MKHPVRCDECGDFWSQHDEFGCQIFECACLRVDTVRRYYRNPPTPAKT